MIRRPLAAILFVVLALLAVLDLGCATARLERPDTPATRIIDAAIVDPDAVTIDDAPDAQAVRLLGTRSSDQAGYSVRHRTGAGELREDPEWSWSSRPHTYLGTALYQAAASDPGVRLVDSSEAFVLSAIFLSCYIEEAPGGGQRLLASVEVRITDFDRAVTSRVLTANEPLDGPLPGNAAEAMGRIIRRLAEDALALIDS